MLFSVLPSLRLAVPDNNSLASLTIEPFQLNEIDRRYLFAYQLVQKIPNSEGCDLFPNQTITDRSSRC